MRVERNPKHRRPSGRTHRITCLAALFAILVLGQGLAGHGVAEAQTAPAVFFIEKIHIETERLSPEIVLSESLLREGAEYSEAELREAVHRINRLPFVLLAEFSLEKGSERGRYELEIKVYETRRWFFQMGGNWLLQDQITRFDPRLDSNFEDRSGQRVDDFRGLVGRRFSLGKRGLLFASFGAEQGAFSLGYQHYNLFDRNVLFSISVGGVEEIGNVMVGDSSWGGRAQIGIPIRGNHALRILAGYSQYSWNSFYSGEFTSKKRDAEIVWVFNSLDDPVLPREGLLLESGLTWSSVDDRRFQVDIEGQPFLRDISDQREGVIVSARRHWALASRQSVSVGARGFFEDGEESNRVRETEADLGHQVFLLRRQELEKWRELRLESRISWLRQDLSSSSPVTDLPWGELSGLPQEIDNWSLRTGLVYRNGWGLFHLTVEYVDGESR